MESISTQYTVAAYIEVFGELRPEYHIPDCYTIGDGYTAAEKLLSLDSRPTAIFANGDEVAGGIYQYADAAQLDIPEDLAIMGQEDQPIGVALRLSSVDHQLIKVGEQAFELSMNKSRQKIEIPYRIIHRSSI
jgi:DNA-binding LacI/PurR family transcriptional regulator